MPDNADPEVHLQNALAALDRDQDYGPALDAIPVPVYITDPRGRMVYWNGACAPFAGREPSHDDRWCVTWQLYTREGDRLPHDECPMAVALKEGRPVRDEIAIARRPDGSRVAFRPYPTPLFDKDGVCTGAVNLLIDISDEQAESLAEQANRCRRLSRATHDRGTASMLDSMAADYDDTAAALRKAD